MKICKLFALLGALALGTTIGSAATNGESIHVNVPFEFVLAGKVFPAGEYLVQQTQNGVLLVQGRDAAAVALTIPVKPLSAGAPPALHFTSNNGREYLVSVDGESLNREIPAQRAYETRTLAQSR